MICLLVTVCTKYYKASHEGHAYWPCDHPQLVLCEEQPVKVRNMLPDCFGYEGIRWRILRLEE
ncbi:unnamed protein product [Sphagnum balticum]